MDISVKPNIEQFITDQVKSGRFASAEEVVNAAITCLQSMEEISANDINELRSKLDPAIAEADRGQFAEFTSEQIIAERHAALAARKKAS